MQRRFEIWGFFLVFLGLPVLGAYPQSRVASQIDSSQNPRLVGVDSLSLKYYQRRQQFLEMTLAELDSAGYSDTLQFRVEQKRMFDLGIPDSIRFQNDVRSFDFVGERLKRDQTGTGPILDFGKALQAADALIKSKKKKERPRVQDLPLPTLLEMDVLTALWQNGPSTGPALFAQLDSSVLARTTAETFWEALHNMARHGFVSETIVSPQLQMGFAVGPVVVPVELSSKNLKNRVYAYEPLVDAGDMFSYLLAQNYLARSGEIARANGKASHTYTLLAKMLKSRRQQNLP